MAIIGASGSRRVEVRRAVRGRFGRWTRPLAEVLEDRQLLAVITVNSVGDADGADGSETLSLRQAIEVSNGTLAVSSLTAAQQSLVDGGLSTPNTIDFALPGTGPFTIMPTSPLPSITSAAVIDGYSQPGASPNTNGPGQGKNTVLEIELDGVQAGGGATGLNLVFGFSTVEGLAIGGFGVGLLTETGNPSINSTNNLVEGNFIGTDVTGTKPMPNGQGIAIILSPVATNGEDTIGGTTAGAGNVISGNLEGGLSVSGSGIGAGELVEGNFIGTDVTGTRALGNGIGIDSGQSDTIGGTTAAARNVISGNGYGGIFLDGPDTLVEGNFIGTDITGTQALPNIDGIEVYGQSATIGGATAGAGNVISGNTGDGIGLFGFGNRSGELVEGNFIGTDATGTSALPNGGTGIIGGSGTIGGTTAGAQHHLRQCNLRPPDHFEHPGGGELHRHRPHRHQGHTQSHRDLSIHQLRRARQFRDDRRDGGGRGQCHLRQQGRRPRHLRFGRPGGGELHRHRPHRHQGRT